MRYLSLFSGIEAASVAWKPLGWECVAVSEIEPFPCAVLKHHYPDVPNLGDVTKITEADIAALGRIDLVVFGSPCQDLSLAGQRKGFDGKRSSLFFTAIDIVRWAREHGGCRFALWENVFGAFSSNQGRDFAAVVEQMAGCTDVAVPKNGWGTEGAALGDLGILEWCVLDAQWFGVAQRRRRVFALADFGDWANREPILLEPHSLRRDTPPRRETGQIAAALTSTGVGTCGAADNQAQAGHLLPVASTGDISHCLNAGGMGRQDYETETETVIVQPIGCDGTIDGPVPPLMARSSRGGAQTLSPGHQTDGHMIVQSVALRGREGGGTAELGDDLSPALRCGGGGGGGDYTLQAGAQHGVAVCTATYRDAMCLEHWPDRAVCVTGDITHTLKADGFDGSEDGTGRGQPIVTAFQTRGSNLDVGAISGTIGTNADRASGSAPMAQVGMAVRRLTPRECERLMGQKDDYTLIPVKKAKLRSGKFEYVEIDGQLWQLAADGPRYKALGNSMAVPCMAWIGRKIDQAVNYVAAQAA